MDAEDRQKRKREVALRNLNIGRQKNPRPTEKVVDITREPPTATAVNLPPTPTHPAMTLLPDMTVTPHAPKTLPNPFLPSLDPRGVGNLNPPPNPPKSILKKPKPPSPKVQFLEEDTVEEESEEESDDGMSEDDDDKIPQWLLERQKLREWKRTGSTREPPAKKRKSNIDPDTWDDGARFDISGRRIPPTPQPTPPAPVPPAPMVRFLAKGGAAVVAFLFTIALRHATTWGMDRLGQQFYKTPQSGPVNQEQTNYPPPVMSHDEKKNNPLPYSLH